MKGESVAEQEGNGCAPHAWWRGAVIYQVYPRSFRDSNGDGIGDLAGVRAGLDHIASLGVDAIWLSPFFVSPMHDGGYDVSDHCDVDPIFGTLADFDGLLADAHARGMRVIIDQVYSHTSSAHPWFQEARSGRDAPRADWYVFADPRPDGTPPNNWQSLFTGPAWSWCAERRQYYLHNFLAEQPDLNLHNPAVREAIADIARFWLTRGVDGFRLDAVNFYCHDQALRDNPPAGVPAADRPYDYQRHLYNRSRPESLTVVEALRALADQFGERFLVAEVGDNAPISETIAYAWSGQPRRCHSAYDFAFLNGPRISAEQVHAAIEAWNESQESAWPSWAFSNHDVPRVVSRWAASEAEEEDPRFAAMLNALLLGLRGTIFLYQGQELGLPQAHLAREDLQDPEAIANWPATLGRDGARTPMPWQAEDPHAGFSSARPWLPVDPRHRVRAISRQEQEARSVLAITRALIALRRQQPALRHGDYVALTQAPAPLIAFTRTQGDASLLCLVNPAATPLDWRAPALTRRWRLPLLSADGARLADDHYVLPAYGWAFFASA